MNEEKEIDHSKFGIGTIGDPADPDALLVALPVKAWADLDVDWTNGMAVAYGMLRQLEAQVINTMKNHLQKKRMTALKPGVIMPDGKPAIVS